MENVEKVAQKGFFRRDKVTGPLATATWSTHVDLADILVGC